MQIKYGGNMEGKTYGYIRVSSKEQNEDRQVIAMTNFGIKKRNIISDKQSGKDFERPGYKKLICNLREGDILVIKSIDRLGRNYSEILEQWRYITRDIKAAVVVLDMPLLDTRKGKDLTGVLIADIVLQLLSYVAETERQMIRQRQAEGIEAAKIRGVKFGRKPIPIPPQFPRLKRAYLKGNISTRDAAAILGVSHVTFKNWVDKQEKNA